MPIVLVEAAKINRKLVSKMETISILGCGWLGLPLAEHLIALGYSVKGSTRSEHRARQILSVGAEPFFVDIENSSTSIEKFLRSDILIVSVPSLKPSSFMALLDQIEESTVRKLLFVSSTSVYPNSDQVITEETAALDSVLSAIEDLVRSRQSLSTTILRFGGLIGYDRHPGRFFPPGKTVGNPDSPVNMIHRDDCIAIIEQVIAQEAWDEVFNCCADSHPSKRVFYTNAARDIEVDPPTFNETDTSPCRIISNAKLKRRLRYQFLHPDLTNLREQKTTSSLGR